MNKTNVKTSKNKLTSDELQVIVKATLKQYMSKIREYDGVSGEKALYAIMLGVMVDLEAQHGAVDAKRVMKDFIDQVYAVV